MRESEEGHRTSDGSEQKPSQWAGVRCGPVGEPCVQPLLRNA